MRYVTGIAWKLAVTMEEEPEFSGCEDA